MSYYQCVRYIVDGHDHHSHEEGDCDDVKDNECDEEDDTDIDDDDDDDNNGGGGGRRRIKRYSIDRIMIMNVRI